MKKAVLSLIACALAGVSMAQVNVTTAGVAVTENFDGLTSTSSGTVMPTGWLFEEAGTSANNAYNADNGGLNAGNTYSYGTTSATERALGGLASNALQTNFGAFYTNATGGSVTSVTITYTMEQWRRGGSRTTNDTLQFSYGIGNTTLTTGTWTRFDALDAASKVLGGSAGALDGNQAANQTTYTQTIPVTLLPGEVLSIRWYDVNVAGSDDGLSVDNFSITFNGGTPPPPSEYPLYVISQINKTNMVSGEPDSMGVKVTLRGIATGFNQRTAGLAFVLTDATGGTTLFHASKTFGYTVTEGDSIWVQGVVTTFRGLHEINIDTLWKGGAASVTLNPATVATLNETTENRLVRLNNVRFATAPSGTSFSTSSTNYAIVTSSNDTFTLRVLNTSALAGQPFPTTPAFNVIGLGAQFSTSTAAPYTFNGYQLFSRSAADVIEFTPPPAETPVAISSVNQTNMTTGNPQRIGDTVFVRGIALGFNQRTPGLLFVIDDGTGGISLFNNSKSFGYTVNEGDSVYAKGIVGTFRGLTQIVLDTLWKVSGSSSIYAPLAVNTLTEANENKLVKLSAVSFATPPSGTTWPATASSINIVTSQNETVVIRLVPNSGLAGQPLPATEKFDIIGLQGQFSSSSAAPFAFDGYQLFPRRTSDVIEVNDPGTTDSIGAFNLLSPANNTVITIDSPYTSSYTVSWSKPLLFGNIDSVIYYFDLDTIGGDFNSPITAFETSGNPDDTSYTLTEQEIKDLADDLGLQPGQTYYGKWQIFAAGENPFAVSTQTFNITFDYAVHSGLKDILFDQSLKVYPNPASGLLNIRHINALQSIEIYNVLGQLVQAEKASGLNQAVINTAKLNKGLYFIRVRGDNGASATRRITVQ